MRRFVLSVLLCAPTVAFAQNATDRAIFGPADPNVRGPSVPYRSVFTPTLPSTDAEEMPWRAANEEVGRIGGHVGYLRAEQPASAQAADPHAAHAAPQPASGK